MAATPPSLSLSTDLAAATKAPKGKNYVKDEETRPTLSESFLCISQDHYRFRKNSL